MEHEESEGSSMLFAVLSVLFDVPVGVVERGMKCFVLLSKCQLAVCTFVVVLLLVVFVAGA